MNRPIAVVAKCWAIALVCATCVSPALAAGHGLLGVGFGDIGVFESGDHFLASLEWRTRSAWLGPFEPWVDVAATEQGSGFAGAGVALDLPVGAHWHVVPSFGPVEYWRGDGETLGEALEFRSRIEFDYRFADGERVGVSFAHISNGGLAHRNPGTQTAELLYWHPF